MPGKNFCIMIPLPIRNKDCKESIFKKKLKCFLIGKSPTYLSNLYSLHELHPGEYMQVLIKKMYVQQ